MTEFDEQNNFGSMKNPKQKYHRKLKSDMLFENCNGAAIKNNALLTLDHRLSTGLPIKLYNQTSMRFSQSRKPSMGRNE